MQRHLWEWEMHMPAQESARRHQKAVLFPFLGVNDDGEAQYGSPLELDVRWSDVSEEGVNAKGDPISFMARVVVDREVAEGSAMWKGKLADWDDVLRGRLMYVAGRREVWDDKGREVYREVRLTRLREDL